MLKDWVQRHDSLSAFPGAATRHMIFMRRLGVVQHIATLWQMVPPSEEALPKSVVRRRG